MNDGAGAVQGTPGGAWLRAICSEALLLMKMSNWVEVVFGRVQSWLRYIDRPLDVQDVQWMGKPGKVRTGSARKGGLPFMGCDAASGVKVRPLSCLCAAFVRTCVDCTSCVANGRCGSGCSARARPRSGASRGWRCPEPASWRLRFSATCKPGTHGPPPPQRRPSWRETAAGCAAGMQHSGWRGRGSCGARRRDMRALVRQ